MASNYTPYANLKKQQYNPSSSKYQNKSQMSIHRQQLYASTKNLGLNNQKHSTILQQQQIADLQRKIDLILMHNEKLQSQKQRYRQMVQELSSNTDRIIQNTNTARFVTEQNQILISKLRKQLEFSSKTYQIKLNQAYQSRLILKNQIQTLSRIINELNQQNKELKLQIKQHSLKQQSLSFKLKEQFMRQHAQLQNKLKDQFLMKEIDYKNQKESLKQTYQKQISELLDQFKQDKKQLQNQHNQFIAKLKDDNKKEYLRIQENLNLRFQKQKQKMIQDKNLALKQQKDNAIQFIKENLKNIQSNDQNIKKQFQDQIEALKNSLNSRKKLIDQLLEYNKKKQEFQNQQQQDIERNTWFAELIALKQQLKNVTNSFLQESQLLKLKMAQKHQIDIRQLKNIYQDKIQLMSLQISGIQSQNNRLRDLYQDSLNKKVNLKKQFQLEKSNLKNLIRKLKVQLNGIQQEFRINIQGVKDQNNTFSMTMMKSMIQIKDKANFYAQENRKLRKTYDQHQKQLHEQRKLQQEKVLYYQSQYQALKNRQNQMIKDFKQKIQTLQLQSQQRQNNLRQSLNKQHQMIQSLIQEIRNENKDLTIQNDQIKKKAFKLQCQCKQKDKDIEYYRSKLAQLNADIQKLKMDLGTINEKDKVDTINQWKFHYQNIIKNLEQEKKILNDKLAQKEDQIIELIKRYKILQIQLEKVVKTLNKKSTIQNKILELGIDQNLVKNLAQVFSKEVQNKNNIQNKQNNYFVN